MMCVVFFALTTAFAQSPALDASLTTNSVYKTNCAKCHGATAEGRHMAGPSLISKKVGDISAEDLHHVIANGKGKVPKFKMPKFAGKLSSEEIDLLVQQIQAVNAK